MCGDDGLDGGGLGVGDAVADSTERRSDVMVRLRFDDAPMLVEIEVFDFACDGPAGLGSNLCKICTGCRADQLSLAERVLNVPHHDGLLPLSLLWCGRPCSSSVGGLQVELDGLRSRDMDAPRDIPEVPMGDAGDVFAPGQAFEPEHAVPGDSDAKHDRARIGGRIDTLEPHPPAGDTPTGSAVPHGSRQRDRGKVQVQRRVMRYVDIERVAGPRSNRVGTVRDAVHCVVSQFARRRVRYWPRPILRHHHQLDSRQEASACPDGTRQARAARKVQIHSRFPLVVKVEHPPQDPVGCRPGGDGGHFGNPLRVGTVPVFSLENDPSVRVPERDHHVLRPHQAGDQSGNPPAGLDDQPEIFHRFAIPHHHRTALDRPRVRLRRKTVLAAFETIPSECAVRANLLLQKVALGAPELDDAPSWRSIG